MPRLAWPRLQNLWNIIYPFRLMMPWLIPLSTSEKLTSLQDQGQRSHRLSHRFSTPLRCTQSVIQLQGIANEKISIENLSSSYGKNISAFDKTIPASFPQSTRLRIFREHDRNVAPHCAGRMVISGRMKDVCAEIDRLARTKE